MNLTTTYMGFELPHPLIPGASPLSRNLDTVRRLEDAGAPAIVLDSLFEEQILSEQFREVQDVEVPSESFPEALSYHPHWGESTSATSEDYLERIRRIRGAVSVPVFASLNGVSRGAWADFASKCEQAGADALELNVYLLATDPAESGQQVEDRVIDLTRAVWESVSIPVAVKLSPFFSSLPNLAVRLRGAGTAGLVLFNRFYQPDIDVEALEVTPALRLSDSSETLLRCRWIAVLCDRCRGLSLAASGGVHSAVDAVKCLMAGADAVQVVSALLLHGPDFLASLRAGLSAWMEAHEYDSVRQMVGSMSLRSCPDPSAYERGNYARVLSGGAKYV